MLGNSDRSICSDMRRRNRSGGRMAAGIAKAGGLSEIFVENPLISTLFGGEHHRNLAALGGVAR